MAGLSKQHFESIAKVINHKKNLWDNDNAIEALRGVSHDLADYFKTQNPLFNRERFLKACMQ